MIHSFLKIHLNIFTFLLVILSISTAQSQFNLSGNIHDAETGEPLSFANVFIANTTIGVNSNEDGSFLLENVPKGNQEVVITFLGYETFVRKMNVNEYSAKRSIDVKLKPSTVQLSEIEVKALSKKKRKRYLKKFTQAFLGKTTNASKCKILNPQVIDFQKDGKKISATAQDLIEVENKATGYRVKFYLEKFEMEGRQVIYGGKPLFVELESENEKEKSKWNAQRWKTYQGSSRHFFEALVADNLKKEGFKIYFAQQKNSSEFHNIRRTSFKHIVREGANSQVKYLRMDDFLKVVFTKEKKYSKQQMGNSLTTLGQAAEKDLIDQSKGDVGESTSHPTSYLFARKTNMKITKEGRLLEPELMLTYGDWAEEGVADLLPFDYENPFAIPTKEKVKIKEIKNQIPKKKGFELSNLLIPLEEIKDGGPPKDGIPSIDKPKFVEANAANFLKEKEYVLGINFNGVVKAFPIKILDRHEIVNDDFRGVPIAITFCPLCASGVGVKAEVGKTKRTFGVSGLLYNSDVLLYDRETESLWSQIIGKAISGKASGESLDFIPTEYTTWGEWKKRFPNSLVLSMDTGFSYDYDKKAYERYFDTQKLLFPVAAKSKQLKNKDKVIGIEINGKFKAYPFKKLRKKKQPVRDEFNGNVLLVFYDKKSKTARIENEAGEVLSAVTMFWFAWYAFHEGTEVY